jgi:hypothetical protein
MKRSSDASPRRLRTRIKKPKSEFCRNDCVDDSLTMNEVIAIIEKTKNGEARHDFDDGIDWTPRKICGARLNEGVLEYHLQYQGCEYPTSWTHHGQFNDEVGEDRGWYKFVIDFWNRWEGDHSLTDVPPPQPFPRDPSTTHGDKATGVTTKRNRRHGQPHRHTHSDTDDEGEPLGTYHQYDDWTSLDEILRTAGLLEFKSTDGHVNLDVVHRGIEQHLLHFTDDILQEIEVDLFPTKLTRVLDNYSHLSY